jgi:hypothetical protein
MVLTLNQASRKVPGGYVAQANVVRQGPAERNYLSDEHRHTSDNETLNEPRAQEPLNGDATVDVQVVGATGSQPGIRRRPGHPFHNAPDGRGQIDGATTEDYDALVTIGPGP